MSAALQLPTTNPREGASADWVVAWRIVYQEPLKCEPTRAEVRLAVWYLLDRGHGIRAIMARTGLSRDVVTGVQDLRKQARWSVKGATPDQARRARRARAARPHWRHLWMLGAVT